MRVCGAVGSVCWRGPEGQDPRGSGIRDGAVRCGWHAHVWCGGQCVLERP